MRIRNTQPMPASCITLGGILAEVDVTTSARPMMAERAAWFSTMLRNAIANAEQDIRFLTAYDGYTPEKKAQSIATKQDRITRCNAALSKIAPIEGATP